MKTEYDNSSECKKVMDEPEYMMEFPILSAWSDVVTRMEDNGRRTIRKGGDGSDWVERGDGQLSFWCEGDDPISNTFRYIWYTRGRGIYFRLSSKTIEELFVFINPDYRNDYSEDILRDFQRALEWNQRLPNHHPAKESLLPDIHQWTGSNCLLANEFPIQAGNNRLGAYANYLLAIASHRSFPKKTTIEGFLNQRDFPIATKDGTEPYYDIVGSMDIPIHGLPSNPEWALIIGHGYGSRYVERPIPTLDEWKLVTQKYFLGECENSYLSFTVPKWDTRIPTAVFRGRATGCGIEPSTNARLHIAQLSEKWSTSKEYGPGNPTDNFMFLDAGIVGYHSRMKYARLRGKSRDAQKANPKYLEKVQGIPRSKSLSRDEQLRYKYIVHIQGNNDNPAYRMASELCGGFVILWVGEPFDAPNGDSQRHLSLWYQTELKAWEHYVPVHYDLSNLAEQITWCKTHDKECKKISQNAQKFAKTHFTRSYLISIGLHALL